MPHLSPRSIGGQNIALDECGELAHAVALLLGRQVGVDAHGHLWGGVAEELLGGFDVNARLKEHGGVSVAEVVGAD